MIEVVDREQMRLVRDILTYARRILLKRQALLLVIDGARDQHPLSRGRSERIDHDDAALWILCLKLLCGDAHAVIRTGKRGGKHDA